MNPNEANLDVNEPASAETAKTWHAPKLTLHEESAAKNVSAHGGGNDSTSYAQS